MHDDPAAAGRPAPALAPFGQRFATPEERLQHAMALLAAGKEPEAAAHLRQVLRQLPDSVPALMALGSACVHMMRYREAVSLFEHAAAVSPAPAGAHLAHAVALREMDDPAAALAAVERALQAEPAMPGARLLKAELLTELRRFAEAEACLKDAAGLQASANPGLPDADQGTAPSTGITAAAMVDLAALNARAVLHKQLARPGDAMGEFDALIADSKAHRGLALERAACLAKLGRNEEALAQVDAVLAEEPDNLDILGMRCSMLVLLKRHAEAMEVSDIEMARGGATLERLMRRGLAAGGIRRFDEALRCFDQILVAAPVNGHAAMNRAFTLNDMGHPEQALAEYDRAMTLMRDKRQVRFNRAFVRLVLGDYAGGWEDYEDRLYVAFDRTPEEMIDLPVWDGQAELSGRRLLVTSEQGAGDTLNFSRYVPILAARGARVMFLVQPGLGRLLGRGAATWIVTEALSANHPSELADLQIPLMSLPRVFQTDAGSIPPPAPPADDAEEIAAWRARLGEARGPRVGIAWSGNAQHANDRRRSMRLERLLEALPPGLELVSLQPQVRPEDEDALARLRHFGPLLTDFGQTASLLRCLDLVVCVDTSVAHLSATLGIPTFVLMHATPDWRWLLGREDTPWYPAMRLFRQQTADDWGSVLPRVRAAVEVMFAAKENGAG